MKTTQNNTLMRSLLLGVFSLLLFSFSCKKRTEYVQYGEFNFENKTSHLVVLNYPSFSFSIQPGESFLVKQTQDGQKNPTPDSYSEPISKLINRNTAEVVVKIGGKCFISTNESEHSIINIKSYKPEKLNDVTYKFTFTFTEADYNVAGDCK